jgi:F-type H+-transporting ATPase subunit a
VTSVDGPIERLGEATGPPHRRRSPLRMLLILVAIVLIIDALALVFVPPIDTVDPSGPCTYPVCFIDGNLHLPAPHVIWSADGGQGGSAELLSAEVTLTDSLVTMFIVTALLLIGLTALTRRRSERPGRIQNAIEWGYESLDGFASGMGGDRARRYVPLFASFFVLILAFNWSGLIPIVGRIEFLRAPSSDLNVTIGLALVAFAAFHVEGVRRLGFGGYFGKFFPLGEFRHGIAAGLIALFVGLVELMLEFIKPVTLSMRLFGNIYGGEVALAVITALTIAILPVALYGLEVMLNFVQALIFSTLTLMFVLAAIESHHADEGESSSHAPTPTATPVAVPSPAAQ